MTDNSYKIILDLCGGTGAWSKPYKDNGYDVRIITLPDYDVKEYIPSEKIYGILAAPPCDEFSFAKTNAKYPRNIQSGMEIVYACLMTIWRVQFELPTPLAKTTYLKFWALENPFGLLRRYLGHPALIFNPYDYGDTYQKKTCLWGFFNIPIKKPAKEYTKDFIHHVAPNGTIGKKFDRLLNKEIAYKGNEGLSRKARRAITPQGFAQAFFEANK